MTVNSGNQSASFHQNFAPTPVYVVTSERFPHLMPRWVTANAQAFKCQLHQVFCTKTAEAHRKSARALIKRFENPEFDPAVYIGFSLRRIIGAIILRLTPNREAVLEVHLRQILQSQKWLLFEPVTF